MVGLFNVDYGSLGQWKLLSKIIECFDYLFFSDIGFVSKKESDQVVCRGNAGLSVSYCSKTCETSLTLTIISWKQMNYFWIFSMICI